jgi:hypothetical protein
MQWHPLNLELAGSAEVRERKYLDGGQVGSQPIEIRLDFGPGVLVGREFHWRVAPSIHTAGTNYNGTRR